MAETPPVFPGCENLEKSETLRCFTKMVLKHIKDNYYYPEDLKIRRIGGRVPVSIVVSEDGIVKNITAIRLKGRYKKLEDVAVKIMESLPKMKSASHNGQIVSSRYRIPIIF